MSESWGIFLIGVLVGGTLNFLVWVALDTHNRRKTTNLYKQGETE